MLSHADVRERWRERTDAAFRQVFGGDWNVTESHGHHAQTEDRSVSDRGGETNGVERNARTREVLRVGKTEFVLVNEREAGRIEEGSFEAFCSGHVGPCHAVGLCPWVDQELASTR